MTSANADFVHLHVHTTYSLFDSTLRLSDIFKKAKEYQMPAIAITDHGNLFGAIEFYQQAKIAGIKPIIGCELYVAPKSRLDKSSSGIGESSHHLVVLAKDMQGYKNLLNLVSAGYLEGFNYYPRVDKEILQQHHEGLIATSACLHGEIASYLTKGDRDAAIKAAHEYQDIFGEGNFYLEITETGLPEQKIANEGILEISRLLSIPVVATNDCHYMQAEDAEAHEVLQCIQTGKTLKDRNQTNLKTDQFYFRSANEMKQIFHYCPEAISNTGIIADRCNIDLYFGEFYLPHVENNPGENLDERLEIEAIEGLVKRMPHISRSVGAVNQELYLKRLHEELVMIKSMGFSGYFLIVSDFVRHAKDSGIIVGPGRGTSASSLVAYAIGITDIDPLRYGLLYERFHNPSRMGMPDIDIDFCQEGRDEIIKYVTKKYGIENVAQIIRFGKMRAKSVIMDVGRAMNIPYSEVDAIANMIPDVLYITIEEAFKLEPRLLEEAKKNEKIDKLLNLSRVLEGLNRHASTNDSGVVISDVPLVNLVPLYKSPKDDLVTQYPRDNIHTVGLTVFDFFGLKVLTMIQKAVQMIDENRGIKLHVNELSLDDKATYELLHQGNTDGVFQLENSGMRELFTILKPDCIEDVIAFIALYRPGPISMVPDFIARKLGKTKITYEIPELEPILKETYGIILYQEQVMQIASAIGNYTMMEADILRRSMSRENTTKMEQEKQKFLAGAKVKKVSGQKANKIWEQMKTFCKYGFNKSHSVAYAMITYQTAYLKTHYPDEFWAAQT